MRRVFAALLSATCALVVGACSPATDADPNFDPGPKRATINEAFIQDDNERRIFLQFGTCNADLSADVDETGAAVTVTVTARYDTLNDCADGHSVDLEAPLDGRELIDGSTDHPVQVARRSTGG